MADHEFAIVIAGRRGDWPGGPRTLTPREPTREPNGTFWFGGPSLDPAGGQVWFRIGEEAIGRIARGYARSPRAPLGRRPHRLDHAGPAAPARHHNRFEVLVCRRPARRGSNACGGEDGSACPGPSRRGRARGSGAGRPPARRRLRQPEHPEGVRGGAAPPRRLACRPASRGRDPGRLPRRAARAGESPVERVDGGGRGSLPGPPRWRAEPGRGTHRASAGRLPADRRRPRPWPGSEARPARRGDRGAALHGGDAAE